jgi:hypothetical protein
MRIWRVTIIGLSLAFLPGHAVRAQSNGGVFTEGRALVTATFTDAAGGRGVLSGQLSLERFRAERGAVVADALLIGVFTDASGQIIDRVQEHLELPVTTGDASCDSMRLNVGPVEAIVGGRLVSLTMNSWNFRARGPRDQAFDARLCSAVTLIATNAAAGEVAAALDGLLPTVP